MTAPEQIRAHVFARDDAWHFEVIDAAGIVLNADSVCDWSTAYAEALWRVDSFQHLAQMGQPFRSWAEVVDAAGQDDEHQPHDPVNHPQHYTSHASGIECIEVTEHMGFCLGNAVKYIWRADLKDDAVEDLRKAIWYLQRELDRRSPGDQS